MRADSIAAQLSNFSRSAVQSFHPWAERWHLKSALSRLSVTSRITAIALTLAGVALLLADLRLHWRWPVLARAAFAVLACAMLVVPAVWSGLTVAYNSSQTLPRSGTEFIAK